MGEFLQVCPKRLCISTVGKRTDLFPRDPFKVPITDFFGSVRKVEITSETENLTMALESHSTISVQKINNEKDTQCTKDTFCTGSDKVYQYFDQLPILKEL